MDSLVNAAARALEHGDALGALQCVALRNDPPAMALRGTAMAQLGELERARDLLRRAARGFARHESLERARCVVAEAEVALAARDLARPHSSLEAAIAALSARGDHRNALLGQLCSARRSLLLGRVEEAERQVARLELARAAPATRALGELLVLDVALRRFRLGAAQKALDRAQAAAALAKVPALSREVERAARSLRDPAARLLSGGSERLLSLFEVERVLASDALLIDACRRKVVCGSLVVSLARRPVVFSLLRALAEQWPAPAERSLLIGRVFGVRRQHSSHRSRLRVMVGRARAAVSGLARIRATSSGFVLQPLRSRGVAVLAPPIDSDEAALIGVLADGASWSTSALALALGTSQRSVQRALAALRESGHVHAVGRGRTQRWLALPFHGFTTALLLPSVVVPG